MLTKLFRLNISDLYACGFLGGIFLLVHIVTLGALTIFGERSSLLLSGVLMPVIAGIIILVYAIAAISVTYYQAIRFGQTRKRALGLSLGVLAMQSAVVMALAAVLAVLERMAAPVLWLKLTGSNALVWGIGGRKIPEGSAVSEPIHTLFVEVFSMDWWGWPAIALGAAALGIIIAAVLLRYGSKGGWVLWGLWMVGILFMQLLPWKTHTITDWLFPLLAVLFLSGLVWSIWYLLRMPVRS